MGVQSIYQFYGELADYKPRVWRRFQTPKNITLAKLGYIVMTLFEMKGEHLFCFDVPFGEELIKSLSKTMSDDEMASVYSQEELNGIDHYEVLDEMTDAEKDTLDAAQTRLSSILGRPDQRLSFTYDFGDGWRISLTLEAVIVDKDLPGKELPRVLDGEGFGIIENCGGTGGLAEIAEAFQKKTGRSYDEYREWLGVEELDLRRFDKEDLNFRLKKLPRIFADIYEYDLEPTQRSIDLIERKYLTNKRA